jgi:RNA polymerase sigma-70 factor (ECF subfamily)
MAASREIEELLARVALRDRSAFRALYERTSAKLFGVCLRILNNRNDAEEVLQEAYVKVWEKSASYASSRAAGVTWLAAIARNQAIDRLRTRKAAAEPVDDAHDVPDDGPSPEAATLAHDDARRIEHCLGELDPRHANAVTRTYLSGWTYQQAADELGVPLNTVKTWIRRSLLALRECMNR